MPATRQGRVITALCAALIIALLGAVTPAGAQNIQLGPFRILPSLELTGEYDDNILLTPNQKIDDFIWVISPGIAIELPARRFSGRIAYRADILRYTDNTDLDTVHHFLAGDARYNFPGGLGLRVTDTFIITDDFGGFPVPELTQKIDRTENTLTAGGDYTLGERFKLDISFKWFAVDYEKGFDDLNRQDYVVAGILYYRVLPKTSVLGEFNYQWIRYDKAAVAPERDSDGWRLKIGVKGDLTAKTYVQLKVGWEQKDYKSNTLEDWSGLILEGEAVWKYREPSELRIFAVRANVESLYNDNTLQNNYYISTFGGVELRHFLTSQLIVRAVGVFGVNDYPDPTTLNGKTEDRQDLFYELGLSLRYQIRTWFAVEAGYRRLVRNSNFNEFDYTDNRLRASVILTY